MNFYKHHLGDYDGHTAHLSWDEDMAYTRLLRAYYRRELPIPEGEAYRLARANSRAQKEAVDSVLREFFDKRADGWHNKRADEEVTAYQAQSETNRRIARERTVQRSVNESLNEPSTNRPPNQEPLTKNQKPKPEAMSVVLPTWLPVETWKVYEDHRRAKRAKLTPKAAELAIQTLETLRAAGHDPSAVIDQSVAQGWTGLFEIKRNNGRGLQDGAAEYLRQHEKETSGERIG